MLQSTELLEFNSQFQNRNINDLNYLRPNGFRFVIQDLPKVSYFCQSASIPELAFGHAIQPTPLQDIPLVGDKMVFQPLTIKFAIQEDLSNYLEIYDWLVAIGFPSSRNQLIRFVNRKSQRFPTGDSYRNASLAEYSDASLMILGSDNNPIAGVHFHNCFPVSLSSLPFDSTLQDLPYLQAEATFRYQQFELERYNTNI